MPHRFSEQYSGFHFCEGETLKMVIRRHWIVNLFSALGVLFWGVIIPIAIIGVYWGFYGFVLNKNFAVMLIFLGAYMGVILLNRLIVWLNHIFDVIIVTNDRVIDITQVDFFHRNVIEARLINVQDATGDVEGFLNTLFDWGNIRIRTANDVADFSIEMVAHPHQNAREIFDIARQAQENEMKKGFKMEHTFKKKKKQQNKERQERQDESDNEDRQKLFSPASYRTKINNLLRNK